MAELKLNVPAIEKLLDYTASGVGAVAGPMLANWRAHREGKAGLTSARYDAEIRRIEAESYAGSLPIIEEAQSKARQSIEASPESSHGRMDLSHGDIRQSIEFQGRKRLANVSSVVEDAAEELGDERVSDRAPDHDWTARFFDFAQDVSSEDMRKLWSRILAGEVRNPGQTSMRTMETLRNMTKRDAEMFRDLSDFVINCEFVFRDFLTPKYDALSFNRLLHLQECGLVSTELNLGKTFDWDELGRIAFGYRKGLLLIRKTKDRDRKLSFQIIGLTAAGRELSRVVDSAPKMDYLQVFAKYLQPMERQLDYLEDVTLLPDGRANYSKRTRIGPPN